MDPLSVSASVIAIATLAAQTCSALSDLRSLCQTLPGRLHAVNNEVADLNFVLIQISILVNDRSGLPESSLSPIPHLLKQADKKLVEIKDIVGQLTSTCRVSRAFISQAYAWRKEQGRLQTLQEDIRTVKANLNIILGASNSQDMMRIRLDIEAISTVTLQSSQQQIALRDNFLSGLAAVDERIARVEEMLRVQANQVEASQFKQVGLSYDMSTTRRKRLQPKKEVYTTTTRSDGMGVRVTPFVVTCRSGCPCACHSQQKSTSPALLNRVLGRLFVGYAGLPLFSPKCNSSTCKKSRASQVNLEYWFPLGFLSSAIMRLQVGYQPNIGILLQLDTLRRVPDTAQCVSFALNGDIEGLKYLFEKGLASPRDVSTSRGYSVLRWALYGKQYETCKFLIDAGADADYRPIAASDNSPRNKACHFLLEGGLSDTAVTALRTITKGGYLEDFIEEAGFTRIHKTVLGLSLLSLEDEIAQSPDDINAVDAMGRTPLAWAAALGDTRAIVTLLGHGADPNIMDVQLSGPLSNAAAQGRTVAVRLLLEAGAHTDVRKPSGERKGSPLNCAARNSTDVLLLKSLLDFGADVDASGTDGKTALIHAARTDNASFAMLLLEYGADINTISADGSTPLTTAITYNSHNVLQLILDRWHEYSVCPRLKGPHLLQIAALYADCETLRILAATDHFRMKYDKQYTLGDFGNRLRQRPDLTDDLALAFDDLLGIINQLPSERASSQSLLESGFYSCFPLRVDSDLGGLGKEPNSGCSSDGSFRDALEKLSPATDRSEWDS
ncbi:ankyrin [Aspergillus leporis]|uniref:Ankyrin n=1 Tax=Aspergillus leporis TaxID=41062 RepID=A0A5N5X2N7_9EURO|nr:ankyrin [Aspergillus leporis]